MTELDLFRFEDHEVHVVVIDEDPWFVAGDVARILGYSATAAMTRSMDDDEKGVHVLHTLGGDQTVTVISEPGLYEAILRSRVPQAQAVKRWVKHDVLPAIRKTGSYGTPTALSFEEMTAHVIQGLQQKINDAEQRAKSLESPARAWESLSQADGDFTVTDAAKILSRDGISTGQRKLYDWLDVERWIFRRGGRWQAMQSAVNAGLLVERITSGYFDRDGERQQADPQIRVTPKGLERLRSELTEQRALSLVENS